MSGLTFLGLGFQFVLHGWASVTKNRAMIIIEAHPPCFTMTDTSLLSTYIRNFFSHKVLESDYVVRLLDVFAQGLGFVLVFEYMVSDLSEMIHSIEEPLKENQVERYMQMLLRGVSYLHSQNIMHRDLKPANLLIRYFKLVHCSLRIILIFTFWFVHMGWYF